jgi:superfamily II DNA or RNA helicase
MSNDLPLTTNKPTVNIKPVLKVLKRVTPIVSPTIADEVSNATASTTETTDIVSESNCRESVESKLLPYQIPHVENLVYSLRLYGRVLDASCTGTGKSFAAVAACIKLNLKPLIICPKSVLSSWKKALEHFGTAYYGMSNYETIQNCKYYTANSGDNKRICNFIERVQHASKDFRTHEFELRSKHESSTSSGSTTSLVPETAINRNRGFRIGQAPEDDEENKDCLYKWVNLPQDICLIFDEAHRCKNNRTVNHAMLLAAADSGARIMLLSATVCDKPENFALCGYVLGLYQRKRDAKNWIEKANRLCYTDVLEGSPSTCNGLMTNTSLQAIGSFEKHRYNNPMAGVHAKIFPEYAARMKIADLGDAFPENQVLAQCYDMATASEIEQQYKLIEEEVARLKKAEMRSQCPLAQILYARMRIEQLKVPTFLELAKKYREEGNAVAIFVNFTMTLKTIADELGTRCLIYGEQSLEERDQAIKDFQEDKEHFIICNIRSGGVGVSLHDLNGMFPRVSIISPSWSAQDIIQALGRIHRANGKSKVRQRIVFCKGTIEEHICNTMKDKIENIAALNDGSTDNYKIEGLTDDLSDLNMDNMRELSEYDILHQKIDTMSMRKARLKEDLKQVDKDLSDLRQQLADIVKKKHLANTSQNSLEQSSKPRIGLAPPGRSQGHQSDPGPTTYGFGEPRGLHSGPITHGFGEPRGYDRDRDRGQGHDRNQLHSQSRGRGQGRGRGEIHGRGHRLGSFS